MIIYQLYSAIESEPVAHFSTFQNALDYKAAMVTDLELGSSADQYVVIALGVDPVYTPAWKGQ